MRSIFCATTFALLVSGVGGVAVAQTSIKIAFVNSQTLMEAAPGRAAATDLLTKEGQGYQTQLQKMQDSINGLLTKYQKDEPTMSAAAKDTHRARAKVVRADFIWPDDSAGVRIATRRSIRTVHFCGDGIRRERCRWKTGRRSRSG